LEATLEDKFLKKSGIRIIISLKFKINKQIYLFNFLKLPTIMKVKLRKLISYSKSKLLI